MAALMDYEEKDARIGFCLNDNMSAKLFELADLFGKHPYEVIIDSINTMYNRMYLKDSTSGR